MLGCGGACASRPHTASGPHEALRVGCAIRVSFEFFPPADAAMEATLWNSVERLAPLAPRFVSVTYGADGSTRERTHRVSRASRNETAATGAPHLTCVGALAREILDIARGYWDQGCGTWWHCAVTPPQGAARYQPHARGVCVRRGSGRARLARLGAVRHLGRGLSGGAPGRQPRRRQILRTSSARSTRGRPVRSRSSSIDTGPSCASATAAPPRGSRAPIVPGILPDYALRSRCAASPSAAGGHSRLARAALRGPGGRCSRRAGMIAASVAIEQVQELSRHGVAGVSFLHAQSRRAQLRHLPRAGCARMPSPRVPVSVTSAMVHAHGGRGADRERDAPADRARGGGAPSRSSRSMRRTAHAHRAAEGHAPRAHRAARWRDGHHDPAAPARRGRVIAGERSSDYGRELYRATTTCSP